MSAHASWYQYMDTLLRIDARVSVYIPICSQFAPEFIINLTCEARFDRSEARTEGEMIACSWCDMAVH